MRVLIGCEFSGIVREAFAARGHEAFSCDLLPTETPQSKEWHIQADHDLHLLDILEGFHGRKWDLLIAHPPCTYLANSGVRWLFGGKGQIKDADRWEQMQHARDFFLALWNAPINRICIENPIPHSHATLPAYSQIIQPYEHGHGETKATCLWLKNLPPLQPTKIVSGRTPRVHYASPGPERWKERSRTLKGVADAMATQWGNLERRLPDLFDTVTART